jgi:Fe-S cluster assembly protein SufD
MNFPYKKIYRPETAGLFLKAFSEYNGKYPASADLSSIRGKGLRQLREQGLPTRKLERWKYTDISPALRQTYEIRPLEPYTEEKTSESKFAASVVAEDFPDQELDGQLWALNQTFLRHPFIIEAGKDTRQNIDLKWQGEGKNIFHSPRTIIHVRAGARLTLTEIFEVPDYCWLNPCTQIYMEEGAVFEHYRMHKNEPDSYFTSQTFMRLKENAEYKILSLTSGSKVSRNQFHADLEGENSNCRFDAVNLLDGSRISDTTINVRHIAENCTSSQNVKSVLKDRSRGIFQGTIQVERSAQKTDAHQLSNAILLDEGAEMDTKPELEIYADDVKCSHGATSGSLDEEALFYLRSRGLTEMQARHILVRAFINELIEEIDKEDIKGLYNSRIDQWLENFVDEV